MPEAFSSQLHLNMAHLGCIWPEVMVVATFLLALLYDLAVPAERRKTTGYVCLLGLLAALWFDWMQNAARLDRPRCAL